MITLGPILGYEWDAAEKVAYYTVVIRTKEVAAPVWKVDGREVAMILLQSGLPDNGSIWRGEVQLTPFTDAKDRQVAYQILDGNGAVANFLQDSWEFTLPGKIEPNRQPHLAFASCNGFKKPLLARDVDPLLLWKRMAAIHGRKPFHLLIMGGDQLYCDDLAHEPKLPILSWLWKKPSEQKKAPVSDDQRIALLDAYRDHYVSCWVHLKTDTSWTFDPMIRMMASIPSVMMWDDHDIFDGYGSFDQGIKDSPFFSAVYAAASDAFKLYQLRGWTHNRSKLVPGQGHFGWAVKFGPYAVLALDTRSGRTVKDVMQEDQWRNVEKWLKDNAGEPEAAKQTLLVIAPIPVVYLRFKDWLSRVPGQQEFEDDLIDHWNHPYHVGERTRLIHHLFASLPQTEGGAGFQRVTLLSGDVHVGGLGVLKQDNGPRKITQIIASGIMHRAPTEAQWQVVKMMTDDASYPIESEGITAELLTPQGSRSQQLVARNFAHLRIGNDDKLWVTWECEEQDKWYRWSKSGPTFEAAIV